MTSRRGRVHAAIWPLLAALAASVPVAGALSATDVFYIRDLGVYFWPQHLWTRQAILAGDWPLWNPYSGAGQAAVADALNQFFLLPVLLVRVLLPDIAGFNVWIAAPFPLMALGAWVWLRRHVSAPAAFVGAACFAVVGPVASTGNFPNLSWAVACIPWMLWAADRISAVRGARPVAALAALAALQAAAGEPVTLAATGVLVLAHALHGAAGARADRWRAAGRVAIALGAGALLSSVQMLPLLDAASRSPRAGSIDPLFWSLHPIEMAEGVVAHLFGHPYHTALERLPWVIGLHHREPFFFSLYAGLGALVLAAVPCADRAALRARRFWAVVAAVALLCAFGEFTPVYPALQRLVPPLQSFRFPVKYLVFCAVALAALVARGADALHAHARGQAAMTRPVMPFAIAGTMAVLAGVLAAGRSLFPELTLSFWQMTGRLVQLEAPGDAARWILGWSSPLLTGVAALATGAVVLVAVVWQRHPAAPLAAAALCGLAVVDPLVVNRDLHPTMAAAELGPPAWAAATRSHPGDRVYIGGRVRRLPPDVPRAEAIDTPAQFDMPAELPPLEAVTRLTAQFPYATAAWGLRESVSYDLPQLQPREYSMMIDIFRRAPREDRLRYVARTGARYCYLPEPPSPGARPVVPPVVITGPMALYECASAPRRVYVTSAAGVGLAPGAQIALMFSAEHDPRTTTLLEGTPPEPAGAPGLPAAVPDARVRQESNTDVIVGASIGAGGGYLNLLDSYDPGWRVEVDGEPATLLRANGLYRAVRLTPGQHDVRFSYRPIPLYAGLAITLATAVVLLIASGREWLTVRRVTRRMRQAVTTS